MWGMAVKACDHPCSKLLNGVLFVGPCPTAWPTGWTALQATLLDLNAVPTTAVKNSVAASGLQCNGTVMLLRHTISADQLAWILRLTAPSSAIPDRFSVLLTNTVRGCHAIAHSSASTPLKAGRRTVEEGRRTYGCMLKRPLKQLCHCHECAYSCACRLAYSFARADGSTHGCAHGLLRGSAAGEDELPPRRGFCREPSTTHASSAGQAETWCNSCNSFTVGHTLDDIVCPHILVCALRSALPAFVCSVSKRKQAETLHQCMIHAQPCATAFCKASSRITASACACTVVDRCSATKRVQAAAKLPLGQAHVAREAVACSKPILYW
jgi:hypothetical protein